MSSDAKSPKLDKIDLAYAAILGLTVVITAWCGYQHELWGSALTFELKAASTAYSQFTTAQLKEGQSEITDIVAFTGYIDAVSNNNQKQSDYYKNSFRPELKAAFDAWVKTNPFNNDTSKPTPFEMPEYPNPSNSSAVNGFLQLVNEKSQNAERMSSIASNYVFFTTMYASISFFEGIGRVFASKKMQMIFLAMGAVFLSVTTIVMFSTMPIYSTSAL